MFNQKLTYYFSLVSTSQQLTWWSAQHNLISTKGPAFTTEPTQASHSTTMDESTTKRNSLSSRDLSKTPEEKRTKRRELASVKPTNSKMEVKTTEDTHRVQTSKDVEPYSSVVTGIPLKYVIVASGSFVVLVFALLLLVYHLFKRR